VMILPEWLTGKIFLNLKGMNENKLVSGTGCT
jgi:hypothetical protein